MENDYPTPDNPVAGPRIKCAKATELVLGAAKEYFNSSADLSDKAMDLARECLNLMEDRQPALQEEFNLIAALALLDNFGITILPLQGACSHCVLWQVYELLILKIYLVRFWRSVWTNITEEH